jgi:dUTP pyrophosphatase
MEIEVLLQRLDSELPIPARANPGDAAVDLYARVDAELAPGERALIPTGIAIALPNGFAALVTPRSGLALKHGITMVNAPGLIDAGYRGEISVILLNTDAHTTFSIKRGDRIAQLLLYPVPVIKWIEVEQLPGSERGAGGFGSSGIRG